MEEIKRFYTYLVNGEFNNATSQMNENPAVLWKIGYLSKSCAGAWGMPLWKHFGSFLTNGTHYLTAQQYRALPGAKKFALNVTITLCARVVDNPMLKLGYLMNYALAAQWDDVLGYCIDCGIDIKEKELFSDRPRSDEIEAVWNNWTTTKVCAINVLTKIHDGVFMSS